MGKSIRLHDGRIIGPYNFAIHHTEARELKPEDKWEIRRAQRVCARGRGYAVVLAKGGHIVGSANAAPTAAQACERAVRRLMQTYRARGLPLPVRRVIAVLNFFPTRWDAEGLRQHGVDVLFALERLQGDTGTAEKDFIDYWTNQHLDPKLGQVLPKRLLILPKENLLGLKRK